MAQGANHLTSATALAYDAGLDNLFVLGEFDGKAAVWGWSHATYTGHVSQDLTRNLNTVGSLGVTRIGGHLGMVVRQYGTPA